MASLSYQSSPRCPLKCSKSPRWPQMTRHGAVKVMWSGWGKEKRIPRIITSLHPQAGGGEMEMDACRVYEEPVAVRSPTKTCHTNGSASPVTWMKTGRCVFVRGDATSVPSRCVGRVGRYLRIGVICHGSMAWLVAEPPGGFSQDKVEDSPAGLCQLQAALK